MGAMTPLEVFVMMRPHLRSRIPGSTASVIAMTETTMLVKNRDQSSGRCPDAEVGGGPPRHIHDDFDWPELPFHGGDVRPDRVEVREVPGHRDGVGNCADALGCGGQAAAGQAGQGNPCALGGQRLGDGATEAGAGSEDQGDLVVQLQIHDSLSFRQPCSIEILGVSRHFRSWAGTSLPALTGSDSRQPSSS
jgi:hypothetical protein